MNVTPLLGIHITLSILVICVFYVTFRLSCNAAKEPKSVAGTIFHGREPKYSCTIICFCFLYINIWPTFRETHRSSTFSKFVWRNYTSIIGFLTSKFVYHYYKTSWETKNLKLRLSELRGFHSATLHPLLPPKKEKIWLFALSVFRIPLTLWQIFLPEHTLACHILLLLTLVLIFLSIIEIQWGVDHDRYFWRSEIKTIATVCFFYLLFYLYNFSLPDRAKIISMRIESLEFFYFKNSLVVALYVVHTLYLKLACKCKIDLNSRETNLPIWFLFISKDIRAKFMIFYRKQGYLNINKFDIFQWFVKALGFYNECTTQSQGSLVICKLYSFVPRLCLESKYIFQEFRPETQMKLVAEAVMLLKGLRFSKVLDAKTNLQLKSLTAKLTIAETSLTNENFIHIYYNKFTDLVQPFLMEVAARLQLLVDNFRETKVGRKSLYHYIFWRNHLNSSDLILHPPIAPNVTKDCSRKLFKESSSSENSKEFEDYSTLEAVQKQVEEMAVRRFKQKKDRKAFRRKANGKLGREKRCLIVVEKANFRYHWNVTKKCLLPWLWSSLKLSEHTMEEGIAACEGPGTKVLTLIYYFLNKELPTIT